MNPKILFGIKIFQCSPNALKIESYMLSCVTLWCLVMSLACCSGLLDLEWKKHSKYCL